MNFQSIKNYVLNTPGKALKYFKKNLKDSSYGMANLAIASLDGFFLNVLLVRFLSFDDLGNYKLFFSVLDILVIFSINGLGTSVTKAVAKRFSVFFKKAVYVSALFSLIASALLIVLAFSYYKDHSIKWALLSASFIVPIYYGFNTWEPYYYGKRRFKTVFLLNSLIGGTRFVICGAILFFYRSYFYTIIAYLLVLSIYNLIFFFWIVRRIKPQETDKEKEKDYLKHGFRLTGSSPLSVIATRIDRIILDAVSGATMVGIYSVVAVFPNFIKNSLKTLVNVPTIKLAAHPEKENRIIIKKGLILIFLSGIIILAVFWFIIPFLLKFFFKVEDPDMIRYGRLLLVPLIFMPINLTIKYLAGYQGSGVSVLKLYTSVDAIKLGLLAIFVPIYRIEGIIIALILAEFFTCIILLTWFLRSNRRFGIK